MKSQADLVVIHLSFILQRAFEVQQHLDGGDVAADAEATGAGTVGCGLRGGVVDA